MFMLQCVGNLRRKKHHMIAQDIEKVLLSEEEIEKSLCRN